VLLVYRIYIWKNQNIICIKLVKPLFPSSVVERQNVKLVMKIFNEKTVTALDYYGLDVSGTSKFIDLILRMWKVLNLKSTDKVNGNDTTIWTPFEALQTRRSLFA